MVTVGNFISAVSRRPGFDLYCMDPQPTTPTPNIVMCKKPAATNKIEVRLILPAAGGLRTSRIASNNREFGETTQQVSVFYQATAGNLLELRINTTGARGLYNVDNVPATTTGNPTAPALETSLATVVSGENLQNAFLFYQATDNRIYYVWQQAFGAWSIPSLVRVEPTEGPTTLSAFSWTESDNNGTNVVDIVCVAISHAPGQFKVYMRRQLRDPTGIATMQPYFEPVFDCGSHDAPTRGPFAALYVGMPSTAMNCCLPSQGEYVFLTQLLWDPPRIWARTVSSSNPAELLPYSVVVSTQAALRVPARGTSIATIYDPPASTSSSGNSKDGGPDEGSLTVIYTSPEGVLGFKTVSLPRSWI